jgi:diacylglycerol kinase (ATP)
MTLNKEKFVSGRLKSVVFAVRGAWYLIRTEHSITVQSAIAGLATLAGWYFDISKTEWMFQFLAFGLVLSIEGLNTAVEKMADFIHPDYHFKIGFIKDIAAGAVFFAAFFSLIIGLFIYTPYITKLLNFSL